MPGPDYALGLLNDFMYPRATTIYGGSNEIQRTIIARVNITIANNLRLIPELRFDSAKATGTFTSYSDEALKANSVFLLAAVYSF